MAEEIQFLGLFVPAPPASLEATTRMASWATLEKKAAAKQDAKSWAKWLSAARREANR